VKTKCKVLKLSKHNLDILILITTNNNAMNISSLSPTSLWLNFANLNAIPRASKKEDRVQEFMMQYGKSLGLQTSKDEVGNILITKPATSGMESRKKVVLQSHLDMVHQKNNDTNFDFSTQGIDMFIDGDWVKARGTTLGADNGIGVATIMTLLASTDIIHPAIEALFTIDEETGMTGALGLKGGWLTGDILLNLDTEEDDEIGIGCAGGMDLTASRSYQTEKINSSHYSSYKIIVSGLQGGHSGVDIHKGLANANKVMNRILYAGKDNIRIVEVSGGSLRNAIPRESTALVAIAKIDSYEIVKNIQDVIFGIQIEFESLEPNINITIEKSNELITSTMNVTDQKVIINAIYAAHNGVFRMSPDIADLVEASNNVARIQIKDGESKILCLTRSSVESSKVDVAQSLRASFELGGMDVVFSGEYPGWTPNVNSPILKTISKLYNKMYGSQPNIAACHAGLECGIIGKNYPNMDMISFGPTIKGAHSPDERVCISSVQKYWDFTRAILENIPER
jgi:dipeptidase D